MSERIEYGCLCVPNFLVDRGGILTVAPSLDLARLLADERCTWKPAHTHYLVRRIVTEGPWEDIESKETRDE